MYCPNCGQEMLCSCTACGNYGKIVERHSHVGDCITCGGCGLTMHFDWWENLEQEIYLGLKKPHPDRECIKKLTDKLFHTKEIKETK